MKILISKTIGLIGLLVLGVTSSYGFQSDPKINGKLSVTTLSPEEIRYTGKPYNKDVGAYVFNRRNYDPQINRWTTPDPTGFPNGANNEIYTNNSVNSNLDPDGADSVVIEKDYSFVVTPGGASYAPAALLGVGGGVGALALGTSALATGGITLGVAGAAAAAYIYSQYDSWLNGINTTYPVGLKTDPQGNLINTVTGDPGTRTQLTPPVTTITYISTTWHLGAGSAVFTATIFYSTLFWE